MALLTDTNTAPVAGQGTDSIGAPNAEAASKFYPPRQGHVLAPPRSAEIQVIRDQRAAASGNFYKTENNYGPGVVRDFALAVAPRSSDSELTTLTPELATIAADAGMNTDDIGMLTGAIRAGTSGEPLTKAQVEAKQLDVIKAIRSATSLGGPGAFDRAFADARAVATRDPRLKTILDKTGAFNDVRVALRFVALGQEARRRGELK